MAETPPPSSPGPERRRTRPPARYCFVNGGGGATGASLPAGLLLHLDGAPRGLWGGRRTPFCQPVLELCGDNTEMASGHDSVGEGSGAALTPAHGKAPPAPRALTWSRGLPRQAGAEPPHALVRDQTGQAQPLVHQRLLEDVAAPEPVGREAEGHVRGSTGRRGQSGTGPRRCRERGESQREGPGADHHQPPGKRRDPHSPCKWPSRLSPERLPVSSSRLARYAAPGGSSPTGSARSSGRLCSPACRERTGGAGPLCHPPQHTHGRHPELAERPQARCGVTPTLTGVHTCTRYPCTCTHLLLEPLGHNGTAVLGMGPGGGKGLCQAWGRPRQGPTL